MFINKSSWLGLALMALATGATAENNTEYSNIDENESCIFAGWFSGIGLKFRQCILPWYTKKFAQKHNQRSYGPPCGGLGPENNYLGYFRCNPVLFGPGPSEDEESALNMLHGSGYKERHSPESGICVVAPSTYSRGLEKKCFQAQLKIKQYRVLKGQKNWIEEMNDEQLMDYLQKQLFPLRKVINIYCSDQDDDHEACYYLKLSVKEIMSNDSVKRLNAQRVNIGGKKQDFILQKIPKIGE